VADGVMTAGVTVNSGATLAGAGTVGAVTINNGGNFQPGGVSAANVAKPSGGLSARPLPSSVPVVRRQE